MPTVVLALGLIVGMVICGLTLIMLAATRHTRWRDALVYFGLAEPPPPRPVTEQDLAEMLTPASEPPARQRDSGERETPGRRLRGAPRADPRGRR
jgi:hypothetical protein